MEIRPQVWGQVLRNVFCFFRYIFLRSVCAFHRLMMADQQMAKILQVEILLRQQQQKQLGSKSKSNKRHNK